MFGNSSVGAVALPEPSSADEPLVGAVALPEPSSADEPDLRA